MKAFALGIFSVLFFSVIFFSGIFFSGIFFSGIFFAGALQAQEQAAPKVTLSKTDTPPKVNSRKPKLTQRQQLVFDHLRLDLERVKASYIIRKSIEHRDELIIIYEGLTELQCMGELPQTLQYDGSAAQQPECQKYLDELIKLSPKNPVALCVQHGIDSESCQAAYEDQYVTSYSLDLQITQRVDLRAKLAAVNNEEKIEALSDQLRTAKFENEEKRTPETRWKVQQAYEKLLPVACQEIRTVISHKPASEDWRAYKVFSGPVKIVKEDPLRDLISELGSPVKEGEEGSAVEEEPEPEEDKDYALFQKKHPPKARVEEELPQGEIWRVRKLGAYCMDLVYEALKFDPQLAYAHCYGQGFSSPACIKAGRQRRAQVKKRNDALNAKKRKDRPQGFSTF